MNKKKMIKNNNQIHKIMNNMRYKYNSKNKIIYN